MCKVGLVSMHLEKVQHGIGLRNIKKKKISKFTRLLLEALPLDYLLSSFFFFVIYTDFASGIKRKEPGIGETVPVTQRSLQMLEPGKVVFHHRSYIL